MSTTNLQLELIEGTDIVSESMLDKMNDNFEKIDNAYGTLEDNLLDRTHSTNLVEAIEKIQNLNDTTDATALASDIATGKTAYANGVKLNGTATLLPTINVTLTGSNTTYKGYISGYGAGIDQNGTLVIWAMSNNSSYEHIEFLESSIVGVAGEGWSITSFGTSDPVNVPHACTVTGLGSYSTINIELNASAVNGTYDYVRLEVTITVS